MPDKKKTQKPAGKDKEKTQVPLAAAKAGAGDLAAEVRRLARDVDALKAELARRPMSGGDGGSRRDQDKVVADRLARLDEKVDSVWNRLADLEERMEGEGGGQDADDFDEAPEKDYYER